MTGYLISISSIALRFLVKLLEFIDKFNLINVVGLFFFVAVLHAPTELVVSDCPIITGIFYNALISMGITGNIAQIVCK